jgi:hypothetical protein
MILDRPEGVRVLEQHAGRRRIRLHVRRRHHPHRDPARLGAGLHHLDRLRMQVAREQEDVAPVLPDDPMHHRQRLGRRGPLVEERGVRDRQAGQVAHHRLVVEQRLEPALRDLGLVGRVRRVPARILEDVALDHRRRVRVVVAHADEGATDVVRRHLGAERGERLLLGLRAGQRERPAEPDILGDRRVDERIERGIAQRLQHLRDVARRRAKVAADEGVGLGMGGRGHGGFLAGGRRPVQ